MNRYYFTDYKDKKIFVLDFSNLSGDAILNLIKESKAFISKQPENSIISLVNITNLKYDANTLNAFKQYVQDTKKYVSATAIYGASFFQTIAIQSFAKPSVLIKVCRSEREAKNWLASLELKSPNK